MHRHVSLGIPAEYKHPLHLPANAIPLQWVFTKLPYQQQSPLIQRGIHASTGIPASHCSVVELFYSLSISLAPIITVEGITIIGKRDAAGKAKPAPLQPKQQSRRKNPGKPVQHLLTLSCSILFDIPTVFSEWFMFNLKIYSLAFFKILQLFCYFGMKRQELPEPQKSRPCLCCSISYHHYWAVFFLFFFFSPPFFTKFSSSFSWRRFSVKTNRRASNEKLMR